MYMYSRPASEVAHNDITDSVTNLKYKCEMWIRSTEPFDIRSELRVSTHLYINAVILLKEHCFCLDDDARHKSEAYKTLNSFFSLPLSASRFYYPPSCFVLFLILFCLVYLTL